MFRIFGNLDIYKMILENIISHYTQRKIWSNWMNLFPNNVCQEQKRKHIWADILIQFGIIKISSIHTYQSFPFSDNVGWVRRRNATVRRGWHERKLTITITITITTGEHEGELHPWEHHYGGKTQPNHDSGFQYLLIMPSSAWIHFSVNNFSLAFLSLHCLV